MLLGRRYRRFLQEISKRVTSHVMHGKVTYFPHNNVALFCVKQVCVLKACLHILYLAEPGWLARQSPEQWETFCGNLPELLRATETERHTQQNNKSSKVHDSKVNTNSLPSIRPTATLQLWTFPRKVMQQQRWLVDTVNSPLRNSGHSRLLLRKNCTCRQQADPVVEETKRHDVRYIKMMLSYHL